MTKYNLKPGDKFGRLTITWDRETRNKVIYEKCLCECWNEKWVSRYHLVRGKIRSCWCLSDEIKGERLRRINTKHWMFWTKFYSTFMRARGRCNNPHNPSYCNYWWRWIKFLWNSFEEFYNDMYPSFIAHLDKYWAKDTTLDRIDVNWDYCKDNCRWATNDEQQENRRDCKEVIYNWVKYPTLAAFSIAIWLPKYNVIQRYSRWWTPNEIAEVPIGMNRHQYYWDNKYKPIPINAQKIKYNWVIYPSIKDFCEEIGISYFSYSNLVSRGANQKDAIEKLLNNKFNNDDCEINFVN